MSTETLTDFKFNSKECYIAKAFPIFQTSMSTIPAYLRFFCHTSFNEVAKSRISINPVLCRKLDFLVCVHFCNDHIISAIKCICHFIIALKNFLTLVLPRGIEEYKNESFSVDIFVKIFQIEFHNIWTRDDQKRIYKEYNEKFCSHFLLVTCEVHDHWKPEVQSKKRRDSFWVEKKCVQCAPANEISKVNDGCDDIDHRNPFHRLPWIYV